jgi:hypothetical protein
MMNTVRAIVREGRIQLLEEIEIPEGTEMLVTLLLDETDFWWRAWDNPERRRVCPTTRRMKLSSYARQYPSILWNADRSLY